MAGSQDSSEVEVVEGQQSDVEVTALFGKPTVLECLIAVSNASLVDDLQWRKAEKGNLVIDGDRYQQKSGHLFIKSAQLSDEGRYSCYYDNTAYNVTLTVIGKKVACAGWSSRF